MGCSRKEGMIIERRDQVLITLLLLASFAFATLRNRWSSTEGAFLRLRGIFFYLYLGFLPALRRRTMSLSLSLLVWRVRPSFWPHGLTGWRPPEVLPSPPPCGWSTGFMATPRTVGRTPFQRMRPALPQLMFDCSALPTSPMVARQRRSTLRISPDGRRSCAYGPSFATRRTEAPAERAIFAPPPGFSSMAWMTVPTGMFFSGRLLPGLMSADAPDSMMSPWLSLFGAMM